MRLSLITVCFNSEKTIKKTLDSIESQSYKNIEYIIIDGQSTDNTNEIIKSHKKLTFIFLNLMKEYLTLIIKVFELPMVMLLVF